MRWIVLLHVAVAFALVAGTVGRNVSLSRARETDDIRVLTALVDLAGRFERWMVVPGSFAVLIAGLWAAWAEHLSFTASGNRWLLVSLVLFLALFLLVPTVFIPRGREFEAAFVDAKDRGTVTPEVKAALRDPVVWAARTAEWVVVAGIIVLMVVKPF